MKPNGCEYKRNCSVSQVLFDLFRAGSNKSGWEIFRYDPRHYLIFTVDLPVTFQVEEASKENLISVSDWGGTQDSSERLLDL